MGSDFDPRPGTRRQGSWRGPRKASFLKSIASVLAVAAIFAPAAAAASEPGTPAAIAPGVPGDGRAWELVTPPDPVTPPLWGVSALTDDGDQVVWGGLGPLSSGTTGTSVFNLATRGAAGWANASIPAPPQQEVPAPYRAEPLGLSADLSTSLWYSYLPSGPSLLRRGADGEYTVLATDLGGVGWYGVSDDLERTVISTAKHLLPGDAARTEGSSIYEVDGAGTLRLVDVDDNGELISACGSTIAKGQVSRDARRVVFSARPGCAGLDRIFMRTGGETIEISRRRCDPSDCSWESDVYFAGMTPSGSSVFLLTFGKLTDDDQSLEGDYYRYDVADDSLTLVSDEFEGQEVNILWGSLKVSGDGTRTLFAGTVAGEWVNFLLDDEGLRRVPVDATQSFQWSGNGRYVAFVTAESLVPADSDGYADLYRYDADTGATVLITPGGSQSGAVPEIGLERAGFYFEFEPLANHPFRALSDDGSQVFFSTAEPLLAEDRNPGSDIYVWHDGNLALISGGAKGAEHPTWEGPEKPIFLGATPSGGSALFMTSLTLLPEDRDGGEPDYYLARVGGGFPRQPPLPGCAGAECRPPAASRARQALTVAGGGGLALRRPSAAERRRILASGWVELLAEAPRPGRLSARATARLGQRSRTVATTATTLAEAGPVQLRMRLSPAARRLLAGGRGLRLRVVLREDGIATPARTSFAVGGQR